MYNDQIIKNGENWTDDYKKDCGIIDTLNQHLYIKDTEKYPLYGIDIGERKDSTDYDYNEAAKLYYIMIIIKKKIKKY